MAKRKIQKVSIADANDNFEVLDLIRDGRSMDINMRKLSGVLADMQEAINVLIDAVHELANTDSVKQEIATQVLDKVLKLQKQPKKFIMKKKGK